ncbi:hypothetical protein lerEdw1_013379 [Lerista edwardsae]|nr:hypothetical protein lerEdw1_013379 [Lerista edwardsae]
MRVDGKSKRKTEEATYLSSLPDNMENVGGKGEKRGAEPDDAELLSLSKRLVENAVLKAVQQYLEETQNKNRQTDLGRPVKTEEAAIANSKESENDNRK